jgi:NAD(P)-dependent dehydrogenase (short-subunit alcohol dehydrogenase family)
VTGASSGIGEEAVRGFLAAGYTVYAGARRVARMKPLEAAGARLLSLDVTDDLSMTTAVETIVRETGQFEVNIFGLARLTQLVLPTMRAQRSGRLINISSVGGELGEPFGSWYHATKFAVEGLSDSLRMEVRQFGIDVVVIQPGAIISEWNRIAREGLIQYSGNGGYGTSARAYAKFMETADGGRLPSPASVVAKTIVKAAQARKP